MIYKIETINSNKLKKIQGHSLIYNIHVIKYACVLSVVKTNILGHYVTFDTITVILQVQLICKIDD